MSGPRYRVTINGFWCHNETWDDAFNWDGKHDEVFLDVSTRTLDGGGQTLGIATSSESEVFGDTWNIPNRVQVGHASDRGGIISGDRFPDNKTPWVRPGGVVNDRRVPPYTIWEGELPPGEKMVMLTPTLWEWDPGAGFWDGWLDWQVQVDDTYGKRAKEIFGSIWPVSKPVFDAVSLGIQTVGTLGGLWSPLGQSRRRPVGLHRDPENPEGFLFNPKTIALDSKSAEYLVQDDPNGLGRGILSIAYADDAYLRGVYTIYVQVERFGDAPAPVPVADLPRQSDWRWCSACQGLYFGGHQTASVCPAGGPHLPAEASGSADYTLLFNTPPDPQRQPGWCWCSQCQGLFWNGSRATTTCPAGGTHADPVLSGSADYSLFHNAPPAPDRQSQWRWCAECGALFWGPGHATSVCPEGGRHAPQGLNGASEYSLFHVPQ